MASSAQSFPLAATGRLLWELRIAPVQSSSLSHSHCQDLGSLQPWSGTGSSLVSPHASRKHLLLTRGRLLSNSLVLGLRCQHNCHALCAGCAGLRDQLGTAQRLWWENAPRGQRQSPGWRVGGVGSERDAEGEARPWEPQGRGRTQPESGNRGGGELKGDHGAELKRKVNQGRGVE